MVRQEPVVVVEEDEALAARLLETDIRGPTAAQRLTAAADAQRMAAAGRRQRRVAPADRVHHDHLDVRVALPSDRIQRLRERIASDAADDHRHQRGVADLEEPCHLVTQAGARVVRFHRRNDSAKAEDGVSVCPRKSGGMSRHADRAG